MVFRFLALCLLVASSCHARITSSDAHSDYFAAFLEQIECELGGDRDDDDDLMNCVLEKLAATRNALNAIRIADKKGDSAKLKSLIDDFHKKLRILERLYRRVKCSKMIDLGGLSSVGDPASLIIRLSCIKNGRKIRQDIPMFYVGDRSAPSGGAVLCSLPRREHDFEHPPSVP
jgi:hypothetical protein